MPKASEDLWDVLIEFDSSCREALFADCVSSSVKAVRDPYNRRPRAMAHADMLAGTLDLDMVAAGSVA